MRGLIVLVLFSLQVLDAFAQVFEWETHFGGPRRERLGDIVASSDSSFMFCGLREDPFGGVGILGAINDQGDTLWFREQRWNGKPFSGWSQIEPKPFSPNFLLFGGSSDSGSTNVSKAILEIDPTGTILSSIDSLPLYSYMYPLPDGGFFFLTDAVWAGFSFDVVLSRTDSSGNVLFDIFYNRLQPQSALDLLPMADGSFIISANTSETNPKSEFLLKVDHKGNLLDSNISQISSQDVYWDNLNYGFDTNDFISAILSVKTGMNSLGIASGRKFDTIDWDFFKNFAYVHPMTFVDSTHFFYRSNSASDEIILDKINFNGNYIDSVKSIPSSGIVSPNAFTIKADNLVFGGAYAGVPGNQLDFYFAKFSGVGEEYIPDFCALSPPQAWFGVSYNSPVLTLMDSSFAGLIYHDSVYNYQWFVNGSLAGQGDSVSILYDTALQGTSVTVKLIIGNFYRCTDTLELTLDLAGPTAVQEDIVPQTRVIAWPNPASEELNFEFPKNGGRLLIVDGQGKVMYRESIGSSFHSALISSWPQGVYFFQYSVGKEKYCGKIIRN